MRNVSSKQELPLAICSCSSIDDFLETAECLHMCKGEYFVDSFREADNHHMAFMVGTCQDCGDRHAFAVHDTWVFSNDLGMLASMIIKETGVSYRLIGTDRVQEF